MTNSTPAFSAPVDPALVSPLLLSLLLLLRFSPLLSFFSVFSTGMAPLLFPFSDLFTPPHRQFPTPVPPLFPIFAYKRISRQIASIRPLRFWEVKTGNSLGLSPHTSFGPP